MIFISVLLHKLKKLNQKQQRENLYKSESQLQKFVLNSGKIQEKRASDSQLLDLEISIIQQYKNKINEILMFLQLSELPKVSQNFIIDCTFHSIEKQSFVKASRTFCKKCNVVVTMRNSCQKNCLRFQISIQSSKRNVSKSFQNFFQESYESCQKKQALNFSQYTQV